MLIPHGTLASKTLQAIVEEFVTRDGTDHSEVERRAEVVLEQLAAGVVELHYDDGEKTCNVVPASKRP